MDESAIRNLVKVWYMRARREDPVSKFVFLWFSFNAWLALESGEDRDVDMLRWLKDSQLRVAFDQATGSSTFVGYLSTLANDSPIHSMGRTPRQASMKSPDDFSGLVDCLYQVRCNLFHGGKVADDPRDQKLVKVCARILEKWVGNLVGAWR